MKKILKAGDFTCLAADYSAHRPDYCASVLKANLGMLVKPVSDIDFVDVGAGTGIWTRMVYDQGVRSAIAIEPNDDMRMTGIRDAQDRNIRWINGAAESINLSECSVDWVSMASSFHWVDFNSSIKEFHRILRSGGRFTALWNPRLIEDNPLLIKIEKYLNSLRPNIQRISSGRSGMTETLGEQLWASPFFDDVVYLEGRHTIEMTPERYLGVWRSVNDLQVQLGPDKFSDFMHYVEQSIAEVELVEATYLTRAWSARRTE